MPKIEFHWRHSGTERGSSKAIIGSTSKNSGELGQTGASQATHHQDSSLQHQHLLGEQGTAEAVNKLVGELERLNSIKVSLGKVTYPS